MGQVGLAHVEQALAGHGGELDGVLCRHHVEHRFHERDLPAADVDCTITASGVSSFRETAAR